MLKYFAITFVLLGGLVLADIGGQSTVYWVDDDQTGTGTGTLSNPFATIQEGINAASNGDTVRVKDGTYTENINFNGKAITVRSDDGIYGDTVIDGGESDSCVIFKSGEDNDSVLYGFTITNGGGHACSNYYGTLAGGGVFAWASSPTIKYCEFKDNSLHADANGSPAVYCTRAASMYCGLMLDPTTSGSSTEDYVWPAIKHCVFYDNEVTETPDINDFSNGGGLWIDTLAYETTTDHAAHVEFCTFYDNSTSQGWEGLGVKGASNNGTLYVDCCTFYNSTPSDTNNPVIYIIDLDQVYFRSNLLYDLKDDATWAPVCIDDISYTWIDGNTFFNCNKGTVLSFTYISAYENFYRNIFWDTYANASQGINHCNTAVSPCDYNIFKDGIYTFTGLTGSVDYGVNNISTNPNLDSTYHIQNTSSSAYNAGYGSAVGNASDADIDGERRKMAELYDIGADEYNPN